MDKSTLGSLCLSSTYGLLVVLALLGLRRGNRQSSHYLASIELLMSLSIISHSLNYAGIIQHHPHLYLLTESDGFLYGPLVLFHIGALTEPGGHWSASRLFRFHCIPFFVLLTYQLPFFFQSAETKVAAMNRGFQRFPHDNLIISVTQNLHIAVYLAAALLLIFKFRKQNYGHDAIHKGIRKWLNAILLYSSVVVCLAMLKAVDQESLGNWLLPALFGLFFALTAFFWFIYPEVFVSKLTIRAKYGRSGLRSEDSTRFRDRLVGLMEAERPFLKPNLSLADLSEQLKVSQVYASQIINEHFQRNFFDFINGYRIRFAKEKLTALPPDRTITEIAFEVGFNSKTTFYSAFKKEMKMTPGEYLKTLAEKK